MDATYNDLMLELWLRRRNAEKIVWKTKNGDRIPINRMSDSHLENAIAMLERNSERDESLENCDWDALYGE